MGLLNNDVKIVGTKKTEKDFTEKDKKNILINRILALTIGIPSGIVASDFYGFRKKRGQALNLLMEDKNISKLLRQQAIDASNNIGDILKKQHLNRTVARAGSMVKDGTKWSNLVDDLIKQRNIETQALDELGKLSNSRKTLVNALKTRKIYYNFNKLLTRLLSRLKK